ncbi:MAG: aspartate aminotransferase family protein [Elusimicrobiota bacterium]
MPGHNFSTTPKKVPTINTRFRRIATKIPVPRSLKILKMIDKYESTSMHGQLPIVWKKAEGFQVHDFWGNKWIDFTSTIFVTNAGHGNKRIISAVEKTLKKPLLHTYTYASRERAEYLKYLIENTPKQFEKAYLISAGTEATETGLKLMRMTGRKNGKRRPGIIAFEGNWHGRTMGAQMLSYNPKQKEWIGYLDPNIYHLPFPYPWRKEAVKNPRKYFRDNLERLLKTKKLDPKKDICGFMLETFQGWGAVFYPVEFVKEIERFARMNGILLAFDEMQAGFGRTGKLFGYMHYGVKPDIICCGKGASSSLPLSIVLGSRKIMDVADIGSMSSTHSANPMTCAAGKANLEALLKDGLIENSRKLGVLFHERLNEIKNRYPKHMSYILGKGLVAGVVFTDPAGKPLSSLCDKIAEKCMQKGLIVVHTGRESIKLGPPLSINKAALLEGLAVFEESINESIGTK